MSGNDEVRDAIVDRGGISSLARILKNAKRLAGIENETGDLEESEMSSLLYKMKSGSQDCESDDGSEFSNLEDALSSDGINHGAVALVQCTGLLRNLAGLHSALPQFATFGILKGLYLVMFYFHGHRELMLNLSRLLRYPSLLFIFSFLSTRKTSICDVYFRPLLDICVFMMHK